jgi:hypothetical protein
MIDQGPPDIEREIRGWERYYMTAVRNGIDIFSLDVLPNPPAVGSPPPIQEES